MYEKLSPRLDRVIKQARTLATESDQEYLGTEHVLSAIQQDDTCRGAKLLKEFGIDEYRLRGALEKLVKKHLEDTWIFGNLPGTPYLKSALAKAVDLAHELGAKKICTEHLVLALLKEKGSVAEQALRSLGMTYDTAHAALLKLFANEPGGGDL